MAHHKNPVQKNPILMGQIGATHGIQGEVRIKSFTENPTSLADYGPLYDDKGQRFDIEKCRLTKTVIIARLKNIRTVEAAEALNGTKLYIDRDQLPADLSDDEFYQTDLIGLNVLDNDQKNWGKVTALHNFGAGDLLEIRETTGKQRLIPFSLAAVPRINIVEHHIIIDPIAAGLIDDEDDNIESTEDE